MILKILLVEFATMLGQGRQDLCTPLRFQNSISIETKPSAKQKNINLLKKFGSYKP